MAKVLPILQWPHPTLAARAQEVTEFTDSLRELVANMHHTVRSTKGSAGSTIALAANQVGVLQRLFVIYIAHRGPEHAHDGEGGDGPLEWWHNKPLTFINPVIVKRQGRERMMEGCVSFPGIYDYVERAVTIEFEAYDEHGQKQSFTATDLLAHCLQHETDHLDGIVFIDRMSRLQATRVKDKLLRARAAR